MKLVIKKVLQHILPNRLYTKLVSIRSRNFQYKFLKEKGLLQLMEKTIQKYGLTVIHGPFMGLIFPRDSLMSRHGIPKLLGSYEKELHSVIENTIVNAKQYKHFVDIGCAEGYYAVGLALKTGQLVHAFDPEPRELTYCREMAKLNNVSEKVVTYNWCDSKYLQSLRTSRCFILSDCEGYEGILFSSDIIDFLTNCDLLIELHNNENFEMSTLICNRFEKTHSFKIFTAECRQPDQYQELSFLGKSASDAITEYRVAGQKWVYLRAKKFSVSNSNF